MGAHVPPVEWRAQLKLPCGTAEMTVNKMLHDGLVRDTQLDHAPSQRFVTRLLLTMCCV